MSYIFNYDAPGAAKIYDKKRVAVGADVIAGMLQIYCGKPLKVLCMNFDSIIFFFLCIVTSIDIELAFS